MATFIVLSQDDQFLDLATYVATLKSKDKEEPDAAFLQSCQKLLDAKKKAELAAKLLEEKQLIFSEAPKDIEGFFLVFCSSLKELGASQGDLITKTLSLFTSDPKERPILRLKLLGNFHNILTDQKQRYLVFSAILNYAISSKQTRLLESYFSNLEERLKEYQLKTDQIQGIYKTIRNHYRELALKNLELEWTIKYLRLFEKGSSETEAEAISAVVESIKAVGVYQLDELLQLATVEALQKGSENAKKAYQLLKIFINDSFTSFQNDFVKSNAKFLQTYGIDVAESTRKLQFLTLANLAASNQTLSYAAIAKALQIKESEVEMWVISAIGENILDAKLDQQKQLVLITRCLHRVFGKEDWKLLAENLSNWKSAVLGLQKTLVETSQQQSNASILRFSQQQLQ